MISIPCRPLADTCVTAPLHLGVLVTNLIVLKFCLFSIQYYVSGHINVPACFNFVSNYALYQFMKLFHFSL